MRRIGKVVRKIPPATRLLVEVALFIAAAGASLLLLGPELARVLLLVLLWAAAGVAWNMVAGQAGQLAFGPSAFIGIGAYTDVLLVRNYGLSPWINLPIGIVVAIAAAAFLGALSLRLTGVYFALATLVYPLILIVLTRYWHINEMAIPGVTSGQWTDMSFDTPMGYGLMALVLLSVCLLISGAIDRTWLRIPVLGIRESEVVTASSGVRAFDYKLAVFLVSAGLHAVVGVIYARGVLVSVTAEGVLGLSLLITILTVTVVGGIGRVWGPVLGAFIVIPTVEILNVNFGRQLPGLQQLALGGLLVVAMLVAPRGILSVRSFRKRQSAKPFAVSRGEGDLRPAFNVETRRPTAADSRPVLAADVDLRIGGLEILNGAKVRLAHSEIVGLIGPNGAGKTSFFNVLTGFLDPSRGSVEFSGSDITREPVYTRARRGIGRTFQVPQVISALSPVDNVRLARASEWGAGEAESAARTLHFVGAVDAETSALLTVAERKRVELARALALNPKVLLLDEPFAGLAAGEVAEYSEICRKVRDELGISILIVEHQIGPLAALVDRLVVLDKGQILAEGLVDEVLSNDKVREVYLGYASA